MLFGTDCKYNSRTVKLIPHMDINKHEHQWSVPMHVHSKSTQPSSPFGLVLIILYLEPFSMTVPFHSVLLPPYILYQCNIFKGKNLIDHIVVIFTLKFSKNLNKNENLISMTLVNSR